MIIADNRVYGTEKVSYTPELIHRGRLSLGLLCVTREMFNSISFHECTKRSRHLPFELKTAKLLKVLTFSGIFSHTVQ